jgi:RimJ/RimL family protein N-acetyltransferase
MDDAQLLYAWRTDPVTIAMFDQPPPESYAAHCLWLERRLTRPDPLWIGEAQGVPVGTVRIDDQEVSVTIAPAWRGQGLGTALLRAAVAAAPSVCYARIKPSNEASIRAFAAAGFTVVRRTPQHIVFASRGSAAER